MTSHAGNLTDELTLASTLRLHSLVVRAEESEVIVGRADTGEFIAVPHVGAQALDLFAQGMAVSAVAERLVNETGEEIDLLEFAQTLRSLGFVAAIDGQPLPGEPKQASQTLPRLRRGHVSWLLSRTCHVTVVAVIMVAVLTIVFGAVSLPSYRGLLWSTSGSLVLLGQTTLTWGLILLHEFAHLATARAAGVGGRIRLSTRLQFLVAQTDVSGIWAAPRRQRLTVYAAGMASDAFIASIALLVTAVSPAASPLRQAADVVAITALMLLPLQLLIFMRTDVYFICQDLAGCRNLYADGTAYAGYLARRLVRILTARKSALADPSESLPIRERRAVRAYAGLLVAGTTVCLGMVLIVTLPFEVHLIGGAIQGVATGSVSRIVDSVVVLGILGAVHLLWCVMWWRRHRPRFRAVLRRLNQRPGRLHQLDE